MVFTSSQFLASLTAISLTVAIYRSDLFKSSLQNYKSDKIELAVAVVNPYEQKLEGVKKLKGDELQEEKSRLEKIQKFNDFGEFGVRKDQNCNAAPKFFSEDSHPRTAISSFPGSGQGGDFGSEKSGKPGNFRVGLEFGRQSKGNLVGEF